jgi:serine/threonine protein kinase
MHDALSPGTLVHARYQIVHIIGKGGMGAVYEALDQRLNATVALKQTTVRGRKHTDAAFAHEAQLLARLHHQGLPKVMDYFTDPLGQFLVMEYFAGDDLNVLLTRHPGPFAVDEVLDWADQILHTLIYLHRQQPPVIHSDIKPQNLKLTDDGQVMLLDFGLAKGLPQQSSFFGFTPQYAPLEQIEGSGTEPRSDLYALAATLYHLLTNTRPAGAMSRLSAMHNHAADPLPPVHTLNPQVPQAVSAVLQQALAIKITDRPASATAMRAALQAARHTASAKPTVVLAPPPPDEQSTVPQPTAAQRGGVLQQAGAFITQMYQQAVAQSTEDTVAQRNRTRMLQKVRKFWVEGVLEQSLHGAALLELGLEYRPDEVEHPTYGTMFLIAQE